MLRLLDIDALDLSKHPYTNYVSIDTHSLGLTALVAITLNPLPSRKVWQNPVIRNYNVDL